MSNFKELQEDVCYKEPEEIKDVDIKVCPDCIPNPSLPENTNWWRDFTPYFSARDCEYHCTIIANIEGNVYYAKSGMPSLGEDKEDFEQGVLVGQLEEGIDPENISGGVDNEGSKEFKAIDDEDRFDFDGLLKSYIRPAIRKTLRHFNKLETDEIVCAAPPESPGQACAGIFGLDYEEFIETTEIPTGEPIPNYFEQLSVNPAIQEAFPGRITNTKALELFARVKDYKFETGKKVLFVQVSIPSYKFNQIPDAPPLGSLGTNTEKIVLNTREFMDHINKFKSAMNTFAGYQAYFYRQENGRIFFKETGEPFYIKFFSSDSSDVDEDGRINQFLQQLENLLLQNGFDLSLGGLGRDGTGSYTKDYPAEIEITFDKDDPLKPFKVANVRARKMGATSAVTENLLSLSTSEPVPTRFINCPFVDCSIGLQGEGGFIEYSENDQTMMGYVSDMKAIGGQLQSNVTPPWLDFITSKTFPELQINYGSMGNFEDSSCLSVNLQDLSDFVHDSVFDAFDAFSYAWNQNRCKTVDQIDKLEWSRFADGWREAVESDAMEGLEKAYKERIQNPYRSMKKTTKYFFQNPAWDSINLFDDDGANKGGLNQSLKTLLGFLNPCEMEKMLSGALVCLSAALTLDELYYSIVKQALDTIGAEAVRIAMNTLPANKAEKVQEAIEKEFKGMPYPWEKGWKTGSLAASIDRNVLDARAKIVDSIESIEKMTKKIKQYRSLIKEYEDVFKMNPQDFKEHINEQEEYKRAMSALEPKLKQRELIIDVWYPNWVDQTTANERIKKQVETEIPIVQKNIDDMRNNSDMIYGTNIVQEERKKAELEQLKREAEAKLISLRSAKEEQDKDLIEIDSYLQNDDLMSKFFTYKKETVSNNENALYTDKITMKTDYEKVKTLYQSFNENYSKHLKDLEKKLEKAKKSSKKLSNGEKNWDNLDKSAKFDIAEKEARNASVVKVRPGDEVVQGTFGKALGNIQQVLTRAYIEEIMNNATVADLQAIYEKIPGANFIAKLIPQFVCPTEEEIVYPKIDNFLSTLTFNPCKNEKSRIGLPSLPDLPMSWNWMEMLGDALLDAFKSLLSAVLMALMQKVAQILESSLDFCDLAGNLVENLIEDPNEGFERFLDDVLCSDPKEADGRDRIYRDLVKHATGADTAIAARKEAAAVNAPPSTTSSNITNNATNNNSQSSSPDTSNAQTSSPDTSNVQRHSNSSVRLMKTISACSTQREVKSAMVGRADKRFLNNISNIVKELNPEYKEFFSNPSRTAQFFKSMGNFLTAEQRSNVISSLEATPISRQPDTTICLTNEQREQWDTARREAFADPELGRKFVERENQRLNNTVADTVELLMNNVEGQLQNAINEAFSDKDPDCQVNKGLIPSFKDYPENVQETISNAITGIFKRLEKAFIDDTIEANFFSSLGVGPFAFNTPGILSVILANNKNDTLNYHMAVTKNFILNFLLGKDMELPETVGLQMLEYIEDELEIEFKVDGKIELKYDNNKERNFFGTNQYQSVIEIDEGPEQTIRRYEITDKEEKINFTTSVPKEIDTGYEYDTTTPGNPRAKALLSMLDSIFSEFPNYISNLSNAEKTLEGMNNIIYKNLSKSIFYRRDGQKAEGFIYGNQDTPILEDEDLVYVDPAPGSTEYTFSEEDRVLGRSATNNPRVFFLDPAQFGGSYVAPKIYISEATHKGWLGFSKIIVPNPTGCDPKNSNFLFLDRLIKLIQDRESKIPSHPLLEFSPECTFELPFDKIANSNTLATLEGIVRATCRIHIVDFIIRSYPVLSNVHLDMDLNFNNIVLDYISEKICRSVVEQRSVFASTYEGMTYYLLFLEQVAQIMKREVANGDIESDPMLETILGDEGIINQAQILHKDKCHITEKNLKYVVDPDSFPMDNPNVQQEDSRSKFRRMNFIMKKGISLIGQNSDGGAHIDLFRGIENWNWFGITNPNLTQARFACKIYRINEVKDHLKKLLKYLVKQEFEMYRQEMLKNLSPRPFIYDISKFFIGGSKVLLGKTVDSGTYDTEFPIGGGIGNFPFGDINDCPDEQLNHPLNGTVVSSEKFDEIKENGGFYLEKFVRIKPKKGYEDLVPQNLKGVITIKELKQFLEEKVSSNEIDKLKFVSDYFGDAELLEDGSDFIGEIGIKFGVRLCYFPKEKYFNDDPLNGPQADLINENRSFSIRRANLSIAGGGTSPLLHASANTFPICSFEKDIKDVTILDLLESNNLINQDLKCYIDKLVETNNFKHLAENVLDLKKIPSMFMIYSYRNFIHSLGSHPNERAESDEDSVAIAPDRISILFNDSREEARRMFASFYKNNDRDPPNEEESNDDFVQKAQRDLLNSLSFINFGGFSFDIRRRMVKENPLDKDGEPCKNAFGSLYKITREES